MLAREWVAAALRHASLDGYIADEEGGVRWLEERGQGGDFGYTGLVGGASLAKQWIDERVLDELILFVVPLLLGGGVRLFERTKRKSLELVDTKPYETGLVELRYRLERER